jgi:hypothetical protein
LIYFPYCSTTVTGSKLPYHGGAGTGAAAKEVLDIHGQKSALTQNVRCEPATHILYCL